MKTAVIIPTYNEKRNIKIIINKVLSLDIKDLLILVVDDTSPDKTYEIVQNIMKTEPRVKLLLNKEKAGLGNAYLRGMDEAVKLGADVLVEMDADLSHDPNELKKMLSYKGDIVLGSRYIRGGSIPGDWGLHRKLLSTLGNLTIRLFLGWKIHDWSTGYRVIKKKVYLSIKDHMQGHTGYTFQIAFLDKAVKKGFQVCEHPIHFKNRKTGKSKLGPEYLIHCMEYIIKNRVIAHKQLKS